MTGVADHAADLQQHQQRDQHQVSLEDRKYFTDQTENISRHEIFQVRAEDGPGQGLPPRHGGH